MEADYLAVARFRKPHGLKGEALVIPITDDPERVFTPGRRLVPVDESGAPLGEAVEIERARPFHRKWLLAFRGIEDRTPLEAWPHWLLGAAVDQLTPPADDEMYMHEIPGAQVVEGGRVLGIAEEVLGSEGSQYLVFKAAEREHLIPFRAPIVVKLDRRARTIEVNLPPGLLEI